MGVVSLFADEAGSNRLLRLSSEPAPGNKLASDCEDEILITPRCISKEGRTLSANTGICVDEGMGNGGGHMEPKRAEIT